jgi:hypothetical protein
MRQVRTFIAVMCKEGKCGCATHLITGAHSDSTAITRLAQLEVAAKGETASDGVVDCSRSLTFSGKKPLLLIARVWDRGAYSEVVGGVWSRNSADAQGLYGVLVAGWNPPDARSNWSASNGVSARK